MSGQIILGEQIRSRQGEVTFSSLSSASQRLLQKFKGFDECKNLNVVPIVTSFLLSAGGNFCCDQKSPRPNPLRREIQPASK
jgi:hypothetical protein